MKTAIAHSTVAMAAITLCQSTLALAQVSAVHSGDYMSVNAAPSMCIPRNQKTWYYDGDGDTFGDSADSVKTCKAPTGYVAQGGDCDDSNANIHPYAVELNDDVDNDCDGVLDEGFPIASSTFDSNNEGWTASGDVASPTPTWLSTGGNPGGCISVADLSQGSLWYYVAPSKFLGDIQDAYGSNLSFDVFTNYSQGGGTVVLVGAGFSLTYVESQKPAVNIWFHYDIPMTEAGWVNTADGSAVDQNQFLQVLSAVTSLSIQGEFSDAKDTGRLDNVFLWVPAEN